MQKLVWRAATDDGLLLWGLEYVAKREVKGGWSRFGAESRWSTVEVCYSELGWEDGT